MDDVVTQPVPPSPGMDCNPSQAASLRPSNILLYYSCKSLWTQILRGSPNNDTYGAPRDSVEQGVHVLPEEDTCGIGNYLRELRKGSRQDGSSKHQGQGGAERRKERLH